MITLTKDWQVVAQQTYNHSSGANVTFFIEAKYNEQDITTNETLTDIRLRSDLSQGATLGGSNYNFTCSYCPSVVGGDVWWFADEIITSTSNARILHNEDGTKQVTLSATAINGYLGMNISLAGDITLPTIPRKSTISCSSPFNIGDNVSINISSKSDVFTHTIKYSFEGSALTTLVSGVKTTNKLYTYSWKTPTSMYTQGDMENKNSGTGYLIVETFSNGVSIGNSPQFNFTANVTNSNPTVDATIVDTNSYVVNNLTGNANILVKGLSNAKITATATGKNGATITSYRVTNGNQTFTTYPEVTIASVESDTFTFYVTDTRGNNNGVNGTQKKVTFKNYFIPYATTLEVRRTEQTSTEIIANLRGKWWNGNFGRVNNDLQYSYRIKESSTTTWGAWSTVTRPTISGENFSVTNLSLGTAFDTGKDYDIQFRLNDVGGTYILNNIQQVTKSIGIIDIYDDEVSINGNLYVDNNPYKPIFKNFFNINRLTLADGSTIENGAIKVKGYAHSTTQKLKELAPGLEVGKTYFLSAKTTSIDASYIYIGSSWVFGTSRTITQAMLDSNVFFYGNYEPVGNTTEVTISEIQIEESRQVTTFMPFSAYIIESGNKSNINWVKYSDGKMECYGQSIIAPNTKQVNVNYPIAFLQEPYVFLTTRQETGITFTPTVDLGYATSKTLLEIKSNRNATGEGIIVNYFAKGNWK